MNIALWIIAGLLAASFVAAGAMKLTSSKDDLLPKMPWVADFSESQVRGIGAAEVLGGIGLVLPPLVDVAPILSPIAAIGLVLTMAGAAVVHIRRGDGFGAAVPAIVLGGLSLFVAVLRFGSESFCRPPPHVSPPAPPTCPSRRSHEQHTATHLLHQPRRWALAVARRVGHARQLLRSR
ncbi:MAG: DoxX family protein [Ilumatobacter sp.]